MRKQMKKQRKIPISVVIIIILGLALFGVKFYIANLKAQQVLYSANNDSIRGISIFRHTTEGLGYNMGYTTESLKRFNTDKLQIIPINEQTDLNENKYKEIIEYVKKGGDVIVFYPMGMKIDNLKYFTKEFEQSEVFIDDINTELYKHHSGGSLMYTDITPILNINVVDDYDSAYEMHTLIHEYIKENGAIYNDYYVFIDIEKLSMIKDLPKAVKVLLSQIVLILLICIWFFGKRFGKSEKLYEEEENEENQFALAVAALYKEANYWDLIFDIYLKDFIKKFNKKYHTDFNYKGNDWVEFWENKKLKNKKEVIKIMNYIKDNDKEKKNNRRQYKKTKEIILSIKKLESVL